jgi:hypothetical protein
MNNDKFGVATYNKIFNQISPSGTMTIYEFIQAMEIVVSNLFPLEYSSDKLQIMTKIIEELKE